MEKEDLHYIVRLMQYEDIPQVMDIDRQAFPTEQPTPSYNKRLKNRAACYIVACQEGNTTESKASTEGARNEKTTDRAGRILQNLASGTRHLLNRQTPQTNQYILGFAGFWLIIDEAHLVDIAVQPAYCRIGIGESLLISVINLAVRANARIVTLEVRTSNQAAQSLYRKYGFATVGRRPGYYLDNMEDALIMSTNNITSASYQSLFQQRKQAYIKRWGTNRRFIR